VQFEVFENREINFELDKDRWPIEISVESRYTSKKIVEEYMIIGNVEAARHVIKHSPKNALIIYHPMPSDLSIKMFN
jgi:exoribonuclease R